MKNVEATNLEDVHSATVDQRRLVLEKLFRQRGTPPPEICLDWAWQIEKLCADQLARPLTWANLQVDASGALHVQAGAEGNDVSSSRAIDLIQQLMRCCEDPASSVCIADHVDIAEHIQQRSSAAKVDLDGLRRKLERQTLQIAETLPPDAEAEDDAPRHKPEIENVPHLLSPDGLQSPGATKLVGRSPKSVSSNAARPEPSTLRQLSRKRFMKIGAISAMAILLLLLMFGPEWSKQDPPQDDGSSIALGHEQPQLPPGTERAATEAYPESSSTIEGSLELALSDYAGELDAVITDVPAAEVDLPSLEGLQTPVSNAEPAEQTTAASAAGAELSGTVESDGLASAKTDAADSVDVMQELDKVTQTAENQTAERDLPEQDDESGQPSLLLETSPMLQVNKISTAMAGRVRKPAWRLRLAAGEGFQVTPDSPQVVGGRDVARWTIADPEAKEPATNIVIMAALLNNRSASLRWRIVASAEDVPFVSLPLGAEFLNAAQANLGQAGQQLQLGIEQLKLASKATGLPTELRSAISARRREFENQLTISKRVLEVVADANQLVGWIDGQVEVHAELIDLAQPESAPVLQFGTLDPPADADAEAEPS